MEIIIIISFSVLAILSGLYLIYQSSLYLYEVWKEKTVSDPNGASYRPISKEDLKEIFSKLLSIGKSIVGHLELKGAKEARIMSKELKETREPKKTYKQDPNAYRPGFLKDPEDKVWKPTRIVNGWSSMTEKKVWRVSNPSISGAINVHEMPWDTNFSDDDCDTWDTRKTKGTDDPGPR